MDKSDGESGESISFAESWGLTGYASVEIAEQLTLIDAVCIKFREPLSIFTKYKTTVTPKII